MGKIAFRDAQQGMNSIRATAQSMIAPEGSIACIVDLLEDPEDARYNLKPEIEAVKKTANKCLQSAKGITEKFEYWHLVIMHLHQTSLSKRGMAQPSPPPLHETNANSWPLQVRSSRRKR